MAASIWSQFAGWYGLARSALIYRANPLKYWRQRRFYADFVRPGTLCFDIGAHLGDRTRIFRRLGARVVAVEPQPLAMWALRRIYRADRGVMLEAAAVGREPGTAMMLIAAANPTVSTLSTDWTETIRRDDPGFRQVAWDRQVQVTVTTLDRLIARYGRPDFCKIDVEGFEAEVLAGLSHALPALSFEILPATPERALACLDGLNALGIYEFNFSPGESYRLSFADWLDAAGLRKFLSGRRIADGSGDVYARLKYAPSGR
jgi:FkbM family methyltransferase